MSSSRLRSSRLDSDETRSEKRTQVQVAELLRPLKSLHDLLVVAGDQGQQPLLSLGRGEAIKHGATRHQFQAARADQCCLIRDRADTSVVLRTGNSGHGGAPPRLGCRRSHTGPRQSSMSRPAAVPVAALRRPKALGLLHVLGGSGGDRSGVELADDEVDHRDEVAVGAVPAGAAFRGLDQ